MCQLGLSLVLTLLMISQGWVLSASAENYSQSYTYYLEQAQTAFDRGDYESALNYYKHARLVNPSSSYPRQKIQSIENTLQHSQRSGSISGSSRNNQVSKYRYYLNLGKSSFEHQEYDMALYYLNAASQAAPDGEEAGRYINLIKRTKDDRLKTVQSNVYETAPVIVQVNHPNARNDDRQKIVDDQLELMEQKQAVKQRPSQNSKLLKSPLIKNVSKVSDDYVVPPKSKVKNLAAAQMITLDDALWATQPKTDLRIELNGNLILESRNIDRFLVITPGVINVERIDRDHIKIFAGRIGLTYLHVWDERGRWTFNVSVILPMQETSSQVPQNATQQYADPFKFKYSIDGGTLYRGHNIPAARRESLNMQQTVGLIGDTPYGTADGSVGFNKFAQSTEATSKTIGLSGAKVGGLTGINIRGYDASKYFSALTLPGQYFRGILVEGKAVGEKLGAVYVRGQDRYTYSFIAPGVIEERRSYVEGTRVTLFPNQENQYSFNYARGFGPARQTYLKNEVYSLEAKRRFQKMLLNGELATNQGSLAKTVGSKFNGDQVKLRANFRDIDDNFTTATNLPSNQGEIGTTLGADWNAGKAEVSADTDIYQERLFSNPEDPNALNYDLDTSVRVPITDTLAWTTTGYYLNTPGELSPRRNFRWVNDLSKRYKIGGDRDLQTFVGSTYQRSRVPETPISDYDRYSAITGFRLGLIRNLSYFVNYEYSWVDNLLAEHTTTPTVLSTGLNYSRQLTKRLSTNIGFYYRNEEDTLGTNSFLAGEDSITGSLGLSYRPTDTSELFLDSRHRNVWRENPDAAAYNEIDVRWGLRSSWDLPISWSPKGVIQGRVYKDINRNGKFDDHETGLSNVRVKVGKEDTVTDEEGKYKIHVRAKKVLVAPELSTVPVGFVLTTPPLFDIKVSPLNKQFVDFGFTTESGIYGVVFFDKNNNNQPDEGDLFIQRAKIVLDGKITESTEYDGTYFFKNVSGGKHTIRIDVNSFPLEYLPLVKVSTAVEVTEGTTYVYHIPLKKK